MDVTRSADGKILPGVSLNPNGRPKGALSGRCRALSLVDEVLSDDRNAKTLEGALSKALRDKPLWFFVNIVMPLLPKETKGVLESGNRIVEWRGLVTTGTGSAAGHAVPRRDAEVCALPGDAGDAGFLPVPPVCAPPVVCAGGADVPYVVPLVEVLPLSPETPPF